jgi:hypothetical protein
MMVTKAAFALLEAFMKRKGMLENSFKSELAEIFSSYYSSDEELRTDIEYIVSGEYLDFRFHLEMSRQELFETIKEETPLV